MVATSPPSIISTLEGVCAPWLWLQTRSSVNGSTSCTSQETPEEICFLNNMPFASITTLETCKYYTFSKIPHIQEPTPGCVRCSTVFSFIWHVSFKSGISSKEEIGCLGPSFSFSNILKGIRPQNSAKICNQVFAQKLSMASFCLHKKSKPLRPQPGSNEPFYPAMFSAFPSLSQIHYVAKKQHAAHYSLNTYRTFKFHARCSS